MEFERVSSDIGVLPEGPIWDHRMGRLYWVDIERGQLWCAPDGGTASITCSDDDYLSGVWLARNGALVVASGKGIRRLSIDGRELGALPGAPVLDTRMRFNDGAVDPQGRLVVGTMGREEADFVQPLGVLYRLTAEDKYEVLVEGLTISNGVGWSPDGRTMYLADTIRRRILVISYATARWPLAADDCDAIDLDALPDGLTVREDGALVVACITSGCLSILSPAGDLLGNVSVPASCPTACCYGGPTMDRMFITTSTHLLGPDHGEADAGKVLAMKGFGRGLRAVEFGGMG